MVQKYPQQLEILEFVALADVVVGEGLLHHAVLSRRHQKVAVTCQCWSCMRINRCLQLELVVDLLYAQFEESSLVTFLAS